MIQQQNVNNKKKKSMQGANVLPNKHRLVKRKMNVNRPTA